MINVSQNAAVKYCESQIHFHQQQKKITIKIIICILFGIRFNHIKGAPLYVFPVVFLFSAFIFFSFFVCVVIWLVSWLAKKQSYWFSFSVSFGLVVFLTILLLFALVLILWLLTCIAVAAISLDARKLLVSRFVVYILSCWLAGSLSLFASS